MKKYLFTIATALTLLLTGCEEKEVIYDGSQTLAYFQNSTATLGVPIADMSSTVQIDFAVSTLSDVDRTVTLEVDADATQADPAMYAFDATATIPANSYNASFVVTGFQQGLSQTGDNLVLRLGDISDGGVGSPTAITINVVQTCPFDISVFYGTFRGNLFGGDYEVIATPGPEPNTVLYSNIEGRADSAGENNLILEFNEDGTGIVREDLDDLIYVHPTFGNVDPENRATVTTFNPCTGSLELFYGACIPDRRCFGDRSYTLIKQ